MNELGLGSRAKPLRSSHVSTGRLRGLLSFALASRSGVSGGSYRCSGRADGGIRCMKFIYAAWGHAAYTLRAQP